jgi:hypothetical protein
LYRQFYKARDAADRPDLRFHDLRHSGAVLAALTSAILAELMARLGHSTPAAAMRCQHAAQGRAEAVAAALSRIALGTDCDTAPVVEMTVLVMHPMRVRQRPVPICWYPDIMPRADRVSLTPEGVNMPPVEHLSNKGMYNVVLDRHLSGLPAKIIRKRESGCPLHVVRPASPTKP